MKKNDTLFFCCIICKKDLLLEVFDEGGLQENVREGILFCKSCNIFYPVKEGIPLILDKGYYDGYFDIHNFIKKWSGKFDFSNYKLLDRDTTAEKVKQVSFYNKDSESYDALVVDSTFWQVQNCNVIDKWIDDIPVNGTVLDIGCGTGRCSVLLAQSGRRVIATDISVAMIRKAIDRAKSAGLNNDVTYFLADAEELPLKHGLFSAVTAYGVLHHASEPTAVVRGAEKLLKPGGVFLALENNASPLRPLFDILMKAWKLWNEEAGTHSLFKIGEIRELMKNNGMKCNIRTSVFLPPHIFNFMSYEFAKKVLSFTDRLLGSIPLINSIGGQLVIKATKIYRRGEK